MTVVPHRGTISAGQGQVRNDRAGNGHQLVADIELMRYVKIKYGGHPSRDDS